MRKYRKLIIISILIFMIIFGVRYCLTELKYINLSGERIGISECIDESRERGVLLDIYTPNKCKIHLTAKSYIFVKERWIEKMWKYINDTRETIISPEYSEDALICGQDEIISFIENQIILSSIMFLNDTVLFHYVKYNDLLDHSKQKLYKIGIGVPKKVLNDTIRIRYYKDCRKDTTRPVYDGLVDGDTTGKFLDELILVKKKRNKY